MTHIHNASRASQGPLDLAMPQQFGQEAPASLEKSSQSAFPLERRTLTKELEPITFVSFVNDFSELKHNLLASAVAQSPGHEWIIIDNTENQRSSDICKLYVDAQNRAKNDLVFFFHQ